MCLEEKISILERFLKDHETLKTEKSVLPFFFYCIVDQLKADLVSTRDFRNIKTDNNVYHIYKLTILAGTEGVLSVFLKVG